MSTTKKKRQKLLGELFDFPEGTMAIGRLDQFSEGLILLTTDGMMSEHIRSKEIEKEYYVQVDGIATETEIQQLCEGVEIGVEGGKYQTLPCQARLIEDPGFAPCAKKIRDDRHGPSTWVSITISEGKNRQIRKMTAAVGLPTLRLVRWRVHHYILGEMAPGEVIEIDEIKV